MICFKVGQQVETERKFPLKIDNHEQPLLDILAQMKTTLIHDKHRQNFNLKSFKINFNLKS